MEVWKGSYTVEVWKVVLSWSLCIEYHRRFLCHGSVEKFLRLGSVEWVLYHGSEEGVLHRGSVEGCTELVIVH